MIFWTFSLGLFFGAHAASLCRLANKLDGTVLLPGDELCPGAETDLLYSLSIGNQMVDCDLFLPDAFIIALSQSDVAKALQHIKKNDLDFRVRSGGHSQSCSSSCDGCVILSLEEMGGIEYLPRETTTYMTIEVGNTLQDVVQSYMAYDGAKIIFPHGLDAPVGIGGHLSGGAVGQLTRKLGFGVDYIVGVDVVLADGTPVTVYDPEHIDEILEGQEMDQNDQAGNNAKHQDLLWAVKGNGHGNFGIITKYYMKTAPRQDWMVSGTVVYPIEGPESFKQFWNGVCAFYSDEHNQTALANNLLVWPLMVPNEATGAMQLTLRMFYHSDTYHPDPNTPGTDADIMEEAIDIMEGFVALNGGTPIFQQFQAVPTEYMYGPQFDNWAGTANGEGRTAYTCVSRAIEERDQVCGNEGWMDDFAARLWADSDILTQQQGTFAYFDPWLGAGSSNDPLYEKSSFSGRNFWGTLQYCRMPLFPGYPREALYLATDEANVLLSEISDTWYINFRDRFVEELDQIYPIESVFQDLKDVKAEYDPDDIFGYDLSVPVAA